jgi:hypothetical protein
LETFTELKELVDNPNYHEQRQRSLADLDMNTIDRPIVEIVKDFMKLPYCFTLQSCYGHFLHKKQKDLYNIEPLPITDDITTVKYRIAYIAICIENSDLGRRLLLDLAEIPAIDGDYIQFGCAEWFWEKQVNSYALQVEPRRHMLKDKITVGYQEALHIERVRNQFFDKLKGLLRTRSRGTESGQTR